MIERLKRRQVEERYAAVLQFFIADPDATGEEAQAALTSGRLTGAVGPPMNIGQLYRLRRQALQLAKSGATPKSAPVVARPDPKTDAAVKELRALASSIQRRMDDAGLVEMTLTRASIKVKRTEVREGAL